MIRINYNSSTGEILGAYGDNFKAVPAPYIDVENAVWAAAQGKAIKVSAGRLVVDGLGAVQKNKTAENESKKDAISRLQVVIDGSKNYLMLDTPTMPLPSIMLAFKEFQEKDVPLPAGSFRYYNAAGNSFESPALTPKDIDVLYWQMFYKYSAIDKYYSDVVSKIAAAKTPQEAGAIAIDYSAADEPVTDAAYAFAQGMAAKGGAIVPSGGGLTVTDKDAKTVNRIDTLVLQNGKISTYVDEPNKIDVTSSILFIEETGKRMSATSILVQSPLQVVENKSVVGEAVVGIAPDAFEEKKDDSYLAYLGNNVELIKSKVDAKTGDYQPDVLWFDSVQKENGDYIQLDANTKSFGLQETDGLDPNISGGTKYLVSAYVDLIGKAENDCFVTMLLRKTGTSEYVTDTNGNPVFVSRDVKKGTAFGSITFSVIFAAKGLEMMQVCFIHNHAPHNVVAKGIAYGVSGLLVQMLDKGTTSEAKAQFEVDTKTSIRVAKLNLGELYNSAYQFSNPSEKHTFDAKYTETSADGFYFYANSPVTAWIENRNIRITNDAKKTPVNFEMGVVIDPVVTAELQGRDVVTHHIVTLDKANLGVSLFAWTGDGAPTYPVISGKGADGYPTVNKGWVNTMNSDIVGDPAKQSDLITFNIPKSAKVAAFLIYPKETTYTDFDMTLQEFTVSVGTPFVDYVIKGFDESAEHHYIYRDEFAKFQMNQFGAGLRYTINMADTKLPVGTKRSGDAPIELVKAWTDSGFDGEGALKFDEPGTAQIKTTLRLFAGEAVPAGDFTDVTFWYARANADNTFAKIPESEFTFNLKKNDTYPRLYLMNFKTSVGKGDILWLFGKTSKFNDGAFIASEPGVVAPFVDTNIVFKTPATN